VVSDDFSTGVVVERRCAFKTIAVLLASVAIPGVARSARTLRSRPRFRWRNSLARPSPDQADEADLAESDALEPQIEREQLVDQPAGKAFGEIDHAHRREKQARRSRAGRV